MKIWVDSDAAPRDVREIVLRTGRRRAMNTLFVANRRLQLPPGSAFASCVVVPGGPDEADRYIAEHADRGDLAVTADIPLAATLVAKGVLVIDPRGEQYSEVNVADRLAMRDLMDGLRGAGIETTGNRPYAAKDRQAFANTLDRLLTRATRETS